MDQKADPLMYQHVINELNVNAEDCLYVGDGTGAAVDVQLSHRDTEILDAASLDLADRLRSFTGVKDIDSGVAMGKPQFNLELTPEARSMGLTAADLYRKPNLIISTSLRQVYCTFIETVRHLVHII